MAAFRAMAPLVVSDIEFLDTEAEQFLDERERVIIRAMTVSAFASARAAGEHAVASAADPARAGRAGAEKVGEVLADRHTGIKAYFLELAEVRARKRYAKGFYWGSLASILVLLVVGLVMREVVVALRRPLEGTTQLNPIEFFALRDSLACIGGGSLGAAISVLLRVGSGYHVPYRTTSGTTSFYRIVLGWMFAAGILCLIKGNIVAVLPDPTEALLKTQDPYNDAAVAKSFFFWVGIGVLAGFNERWVKRLFSPPVTGKDKERGKER
ncbi:hypothetical protein [Streptomyces sp.]|uniref:hypothetical protein n=1 Tax=Streptomyces sp. TaxID=1931 RepID=UPI002F3F7D67